MYFNLYLG